MNSGPNSENAKSSWWIYLINGPLLIILGIWMWKMPSESFQGMLFIVGLIVAISGFIVSFRAIYFRKVLLKWGWNLASGVVDLLIGLFLIANPDAILMIITFFISFWLVIRGVGLLRDAMVLKKAGSNRWKWLLGFGMFLLLLAIVLIWHPQIVGLTLVFWLAISFITLGIFRIVLGFKLLVSSRS